ncbi:MAG: hypothetical protein ABIH36_01450 [bacterium]
MTFHCIAFPVQIQTVNFLRAACIKRKIDFNLINPAAVDYTNTSNIPMAGDILYRAPTVQSNSKDAGVVEGFLLHDQVTTFYHSYQRALCRFVSSFVVHQKANLPIPKTIPRLSCNRKLLKKYVDYVGGFPVIIKATGGSHGIGVMKVDSMESLFSIVDYLHQSHQHIIMRQFIDVATSARLIVLGNQIVSSIEYAAPDDDFRSNVGIFPIVKAKEFPPEIQKLAIEATQLLGVDFGGVDILIDNESKPFITEVNFPCNFARAQKTTGIDIAGLMVDFLVQKSKRSTGD